MFVDDLTPFISPCEKAHTPFQNCLDSPPASEWSMSCTRRTLDIFIALCVLFVFAIPLMILALCVRVTSKGKALFLQDRVGRGGRYFRIYKLRTMIDHQGRPAGLTKDGDRRVTRFGGFLRKFKLDELPQFYNVLRGDMSVVGPRPKLPQYAGPSNMPYRPGITGAATIVFRCEGEILRSMHTSRIDRFYTERIGPLKARLDACYMCRATLYSDIRVLGSTALACVMPSRVPTVTYADLATGSTQQGKSEGSE